ncbi:hypothetical protein SEA_DANTE_82 [Mycobacterium phage Dante]|uniref:Uncharacterized protein n=1 Tax=Mycobacterium phage Dante TaxID=1698357 RepID=A0A0K1Y7U9_9CAUD|nr:hypothetical protein AVV07_gp082 [Mycobacterium phage Dante]AKY02993.1 hypothetical protein SEA_DANTE_82 [Mycobacterium phage Dante]WNM74068.1 hypothetical protein SEA_LUNABLU_88 [Mycobacterium Phage LunaBlu]
MTPDNIASLPGVAVIQLPPVITDEWGDQHVDVPIHGQKTMGELRIEPPSESFRNPGTVLPGRIRDVAIPMPVSVLDAPGLAAGILAAAAVVAAGEGA